MSLITNETFKDASANNFSIDAVGDNVRQVGISPMSVEHWSMRFNQNSSPVTVSQRDGDFNFRGNDFTIEGWVNLDRYDEEIDEYGNTLGSCVYSCYSTDALNGMYILVKNLKGNNFISERVAVSLFYNNEEIITGFVPESAISKWFHISVTRLNSVMFLIHINGKHVKTTFKSVDMICDSAPYIGGISSSNIATTLNQPRNLIGYMHGVRVSNTARYGERDFILSYVPYGRDEYTLLLLFQTERLQDESRDANAPVSILTPSVTLTYLGTVPVIIQGTQITPTSPLPISRAYNPSYHYGSVKLNGQNNIVVRTGDMDFVDSSWTIECWFFPENVTSNSNLQVILNTYGGTTNTPGIMIGIQYDDATLTTYVYFQYTDDLNNTYSKMLPATDYGLFENVWSHLSFVYKNNIVDHGTNIPVGMFLMGYLNGKPLMVPDNTFNINILNRHDLVIGANIYDNNYVNRFKGYISGVNINRAALKNKVYTNLNTNWLESYIPNKSQIDANADTVVQLKFNNLSVYDAVGRSAITPYGNLESSDTEKKISASCYYFNGNDSYLTVSPLTIYDTVFESDFTVEGWIRWESLTHTSNPGVFQISMSEKGFNTDYNSGICLFVDSNNNNAYTVVIGSADGLSDIRITPQEAYASINIWQHIAIVRSKGSILFFINGNQKKIESQTYQHALVGSSICLGTHYDGTKLFSGYIDGFKITKDIARYTSIFDPESVNFQI